jgi:hypothetical protein
VVIDPFSDNCTVVTGSHNLGFRASHNNDENMLIIRGHRGLAAAYACHVLDLYDHYAWRFLLREHPEVFGKPLQPDDTWQERYISGPEEKSPELRFWLSAATGTDTPTSGALPQGSTPGQPTRKRAGRHEEILQDENGAEEDENEDPRKEDGGASAAEKEDGRARKAESAGQKKGGHQAESRKAEGRY